MMLKASQITSTTKDSTNGTKPITALRIWKHVLGVKKSSESDMDKSNLYGNQIRHFVN
jgi:hypothetical protein